MEIYVVLPKYDYEGLGSPIKAFKDFDKAVEYKESLYWWKASRPSAYDFSSDISFWDAEEEWRKGFEDVPSYADAYIVESVELKGE